MLYLRHAIAPERIKSKLMTGTFENQNQATTHLTMLLASPLDIVTRLAFLFKEGTIQRLDNVLDFLEARFTHQGPKYIP